jgi:hypothetical protein
VIVLLQTMSSSDVYNRHQSSVDFSKSFSHSDQAISEVKLKQSWNLSIVKLQSILKQLQELHAQSVSQASNPNPDAGLESNYRLSENLLFDAREVFRGLENTVNTAIKSKNLSLLQLKNTHSNTQLIRTTQENLQYNQKVAEITHALKSTIEKAAATLLQKYKQQLQALSYHRPALNLTKSVSNPIQSTSNSGAVPSNPLINTLQLLNTLNSLQNDMKSSGTSVSSLKLDSTAHSTAQRERTIRELTATITEIQQKLDFLHENRGKSQAQNNRMEEDSGSAHSYSYAGASAGRLRGSYAEQENEAKTAEPPLDPAEISKKIRNLEHILGNSVKILEKLRVEQEKSVISVDPALNFAYAAPPASSFAGKGFETFNSERKAKQIIANSANSNGNPGILSELAQFRATSMRSEAVNSERKRPISLVSMKSPQPAAISQSSQLKRKAMYEKFEHEIRDYHYSKKAETLRAKEQQIIEINQQRKKDVLQKLAAEQEKRDKRLRLLAIMQGIDPSKGEIGPGAYDISYAAVEKHIPGANIVENSAKSENLGHFASNPTGELGPGSHFINENATIRRVTGVTAFAGRHSPHKTAQFQRRTAIDALIAAERAKKLQKLAEREQNSAELSEIQPSAVFLGPIERSKQREKAELLEKIRIQQLFDAFEGAQHRRNELSQRREAQQAELYNFVAGKQREAVENAEKREKLAAEAKKSHLILSPRHFATSNYRNSSAFSYPRAFAGEKHAVSARVRAAKQAERLELAQNAVAYSNQRISLRQRAVEELEETKEPWEKMIGREPDTDYSPNKGKKGLGSVPEQENGENSADQQENQEKSAENWVDHRNYDVERGLAYRARRIVGFSMGKTTGRSNLEAEIDDLDVEEQLQLNPNYNFTKPSIRAAKFASLSATKPRKTQELSGGAGIILSDTEIDYSASKLSVLSTKRRSLAFDFGKIRARSDGEISEEDWDQRDLLGNQEFPAKFTEKRSRAAIFGVVREKFLENLEKQAAKEAKLALEQGERLILNPDDRAIRGKKPSHSFNYSARHDNHDESASEIEDLEAFGHFTEKSQRGGGPGSYNPLYSAVDREPTSYSAAFAEQIGLETKILLAQERQAAREERKSKKLEQKLEKLAQNSENYAELLQKGPNFGLSVGRKGSESDLSLEEREGDLLELNPSYSTIKPRLSSANFGLSAPREEGNSSQDERDFLETTEKGPMPLNSIAPWHKLTGRITAEAEERAISAQISALEGQNLLISPEIQSSSLAAAVSGAGKFGTEDRFGPGSGEIEANIFPRGKFTNFYENQPEISGNQRGISFARADREFSGLAAPATAENKLNLEVSAAFAATKPERTAVKWLETEAIHYNGEFERKLAPNSAEINYSGVEKGPKSANFGSADRFSQEFQQTKLSALDFDNSAMKLRIPSAIFGSAERLDSVEGTIWGLNKAPGAPLDPNLASTRSNPWATSFPREPRFPSQGNSGENSTGSYAIHYSGVDSEPISANFGSADRWDSEKPVDNRPALDPQLLPGDPKLISFARAERFIGIEANLASPPLLSPDLSGIKPHAPAAVFGTAPRTENPTENQVNEVAELFRRSFSPRNDNSREKPTGSVLVANFSSYYRAKRAQNQTQNQTQSHQQPLEGQEIAPEPPSSEDLKQEELFAEYSDSEISVATQESAASQPMAGKNNNNQQGMLSSRSNPAIRSTSLAAAPLPPAAAVAAVAKPKKTVKFQSPAAVQSKNQNNTSNNSSTAKVSSNVRHLIADLSRLKVSSSSKSINNPASNTSKVATKSNSSSDLSKSSKLSSKK